MSHLKGSNFIERNKFWPARKVQNSERIECLLWPFYLLHPFPYSPLCWHTNTLGARMRAPFTFGPVYLHKGCTKNAPVSAFHLRACAHWHVMIYQKLARFGWKGTDLLFSLCVFHALAGWLLEWPPATPLPPLRAEPARGVLRCRQAGSIPRCVLTSTCQELPLPLGVATPAI